MELNPLGSFPKHLPLQFDHQATTPCPAAVVEAMAPYWNEIWGNPSSRQNRTGLQSAAALSLAREQLASCLDVSPDRLVFTSGATEANNLALLGHARAKALEIGSPGHIITLSTEHKSVLDPLRQLVKEGFRLTEIDPDNNGLVSRDQLISSFAKDTFLVSVMIANNEIGVLQPIAELAKECRARGITFHSDAAQAFGHLHLDPDELGLDLMSISAHKIYGPKGIGALLMSSDVAIAPLQYGGGQENGLRPGTVPLPLIVGFAKAAELALKDLPSLQTKLLALRNQLWHGLKEELPDLLLNGSLSYRLPHNLNFTVLGVSGNKLHRALRPLLSCSSGSACISGSHSHVLRALGRSLNEAEASLRLSLGKDTTSFEVEQAVKVICKVVRELREGRV